MTNLVAFLQDSVKAVESQGQVDVIYFDFAKAFDKMPHHILLEKTRAYGINNFLNEWLSSYLKNRCFTVRFGGGTSRNRFYARSGVPQGSNLGPLLFILFINDVSRIITCNFQMYADDIKIYKQIKNINDHHILQYNINAIVAWAEKNFMPLNFQKTKHLILSRKRAPSFYDYKIENQSVNTVNSALDLGLTIDSHLYYHNYINCITSKARRNLGLILWICRGFVSVKTCNLLYNSLVRSRLEYCCIVWNTKSAYLQNSIESVQNRYVNWIAHKFPTVYGDMNKEDICKDLNLVSLKDRRTFFDLLFFHRNLHCRLPVNYQMVRRLPTLQLRNYRQFVTPLGFTISPVERCTAIAVKYQNIVDLHDDNEVKFKERVKNLIRDGLPSEGV